jgi:formamidopyrimidine-DNA glycosylase
VILSFKDGTKLFFNDQRKFGWVRLVPSDMVPNLEFISKLGPEPLEPEFTRKQFVSAIRQRPNRGIKSVLLDQSIIAGIGNIYADESLWGAKLHPTTLIKDISTQKLYTLFDEMRFVLKLAIEKGGSTDRNYVDAQGKKGSYLNFARVFRREGQDCPRCGRKIVKIRVANRGTHVCLFCQKAPKK